MSVARRILAVFDWKVRGLRVVEVIGAACLIALIFSVYLAKADAARQGAEITALETKIAAEHQRVRLLSTEVARLEQPARLEALSRNAGLAPADVTRQAGEAALPALVPAPEPVPPPSSPVQP